MPFATPFSQLTQSPGPTVLPPGGPVFEAFMGLSPVQQQFLLDLRNGVNNGLYGLNEAIGYAPIEGISVELAAGVLSTPVERRSSLPNWQGSAPTPMLLPPMPGLPNIGATVSLTSPTQPVSQGVSQMPQMPGVLPGGNMFPMAMSNQMPPDQWTTMNQQQGLTPEQQRALIMQQFQTGQITSSDAQAQLQATGLPPATAIQQVAGVVPATQPGIAPAAGAVDPLTGAPLPATGPATGMTTYEVPNLFGLDDSMGWAFAPWSETAADRALTWDAAFASSMAGVPNRLYGNVPSMEMPLETAYLMNRGMGNTAPNATYSSFLGNPSQGAGMNWQSMIDSAIGLIGQQFAPPAVGMLPPVAGAVPAAGTAALPPGMPGPVGSPAGGNGQPLPFSAGQPAGTFPLPPGTQGPFGMPAGAAPGSTNRVFTMANGQPAGPPMAGVGAPLGALPRPAASSVGGITPTAPTTLGPTGIPNTSIDPITGTVNLDQAFQSYLADSGLLNPSTGQNLQFNAALASIMPQIPMFLADAMTKVAQNSFAQWAVQLPQGTAAMGQNPLNFSWLNAFGNNGFNF